MTAEVSGGDSFNLNDEQWRLLDRIADQFEQDWVPGIVCEPYLQRVPQDPPELRRELQAWLLRVDEQKQRLHDEQLSAAGSARPADSAVPSPQDASEAHDAHRPNAANEDGQLTHILSRRVTAEDDGSLPSRIGRYAVRRRLGAGGFGTVYLGHDEQADRQVAIKLPSAKLLARQRAREEFLQEARSVAKLRHIGIVELFDVGDDGPEGVPYLVYRYIEGSDLHERLRAGRLAHVDAARLVAQVAEALNYAHTQRVIHRDIKPANILLDDAGRPYVADFGLAVHCGDLGRERGRLAGTPQYMAPEQVRGEGHRSDNRTDIFSLGVVLYELLTGEVPFRGHSPDDLFDAIERTEPWPPRGLDPSVPRELERICLKALAKKRPDRYQNAGDMAEELWAAVRSLEGEPPAVAPGAAPAVAPVSPIVVQVQFPTGPVTPASLPQTAAVGVMPLSAMPAAGATPAPHTTPDSAELAVRVQPKGLRSFDADDKDFFLELLPGPRDREGLPDSIRFWKSRIESRDAETSFSIGLIYGPSGCGKSSLVKAGLLPHLADSVLPLYLEATRDDTESRLARALCKTFPELQRLSATAPQPLTLSTLISAIRRGETQDARKLLIVVDQFEQWLHTHGTDLEHTDLLDALRQADGVRVQFVLMVRDDFWLAVSRLADALELHFVPGQNQRLVDKFDPRHARRVLQLFGQAYGCLPQRSTQFSSDQNSFLDHVVERLSEDGKVISVRLSLLADMMQGRTWTPETLRAVGGTEGVGVTFLEETFQSRTASPEHRLYATPARHVLTALLPETGTDIKGRLRSRADLLAASGLAPPRFDRLLTILDQELRIITPADVEEKDEGGRMKDETSPSDGPSSLIPHPSSFRYYQLTHDYLVPSLRAWLTQKERETWRGRARLRLAERTAQWTRSRESRFLPSPLEYASIALAVSRRQRTPDQRKLMRAARRWYASVATAALCALAVLTWVAWEANGRVQARRLVEQVYTAEPLELERIVAEGLPTYRRWADRLLHAVAADESAGGQSKRLRASVALVAVDPRQVPYLSQRLLDCSVDEFQILRNSLRPHADPLRDELWKELRVGQPSSADDATRSRGFHAGWALADFAAKLPDWNEDDATFLARQLVASNPDYQLRLRSYLEPIRGKLLGPLEVIFRDASARDSLREAGANALADFAGGDAERLARLTSAADALQFRVVFERLASTQPLRADAQPTLRDIMRQQPDVDLDEDRRVALGRERAGAAIALLRLGQPDAVFDALRVREDPESLTQFAARVHDRDVAPADLLGYLNQASDETVRFGLLLALGEFELGECPITKRDAFSRQLLDWYANDPSSAIHGACGWLLRKWDFHDAVRKLDQRVVPYDPKREWFTVDIKTPLRDSLRSDFLTFVVFQPGKYQRGSTESERHREKEDERLHVIQITRPFAMLDREVTRDLWQPFDEAVGKNYGYSAEHSPTLEHPVTASSWYMAVEFCRWLTTQSGLSEADQCYDNPDQLPKGADGYPKNWPFHPERRGFRLPTEGEWEAACRAGTRTTYGFGSDRSLLGKFAWFSENSELKTHVYCGLWPNQRGLFDMHGNVWEWCHDWKAIYPDTAEMQDPIGHATPTKGGNRVLRGGAYDSFASTCRSANRGGGNPTDRGTYYGFRVVVSCVDCQ